MQQATTNSFCIANLKMHGDLRFNAQLFEAFLKQIPADDHVAMVVCVPYPYLAQAQQYFQNTHIAWGAQNMSKETEGAFTGEVSARMLRDFGAEYVIIGHSERATAYCESDENIATKFYQAKAHGLTPILCVGETLIEREAGVMERVVDEQLSEIIAMYGAEVFADTIIAYEPIWAIGTGLPATPAQAQAMHLFIRNKITQLDEKAAQSLRIIYGGSVNPQNALQLFVEQDIDGGLVGRGALDVASFQGIVQAAVNS